MLVSFLSRSDHKTHPSSESKSKVIYYSINSVAVAAKLSYRPLAEAEVIVQRNVCEACGVREFISGESQKLTTNRSEAVHLLVIV